MADIEKMTFILEECYTIETKFKDVLHGTSFFHEGTIYVKDGHSGIVFLTKFPNIMPTGTSYLFSNLEKVFLHNQE